MCYHNRVKLTRAEKIWLMEMVVQLELPLDIPLQSGFDYGSWPILQPAANCDLKFAMMEWGFIPFYLRNWDAVKKIREGYKDNNGKFHPQ